MELSQRLTCNLETPLTPPDALESLGPAASSSAPSPLASTGPTRIGVLLASTDHGLGVARQQLLLGTVGLLALGVASHGSLAKVLGCSRHGFILQPLALPIGAVLGLSLGLPGLFILLTVTGQYVPPRFGLRLAARAYFVLGAICAAFTPILLLFDHTGGSLELTVAGMAFTYFVGGAWGLIGLAWALWSALEKRTVRAFALLGGWVTYTTVLAGYLWLKLNFLMWS